MQTCTESGGLLSCRQDKIQVKKEKSFFFFFFIQNKEKYIKNIYIYNTYTVHSGKKNVCIYFNKREYTSPWAEQKYFAG